MQNTKESLKTFCLEKWKGEFELDDRLKGAEASFDTWYNKICEYPLCTQDVASILLKNLEYYSRQTVNKLLVQLHIQLKQHSDVTDQNTIYSFFHSPNQPNNSSTEYRDEYMWQNKIEKGLCCDNMDVITDAQWPCIQNIVFIDDFAGSGNSFIQEIERNLSRYKKKTVYFIVISIMQQAIDTINAFTEQNAISFILLKMSIQKKAFERNLFPDSQIAKYYFCNMSKDLGINYERLGHEKCQSLIAFYNNTPNNTLGFIHHKTKLYQPLFPRKTKKEKLSLKSLELDRQQRNIANYNNRVKQHGFSE